MLELMYGDAFLSSAMRAVVIGWLVVGGKMEHPILMSF